MSDESDDPYGFQPQFYALQPSRGVCGAFLPLYDSFACLHDSFASFLLFDPFALQPFSHTKHCLLWGDVCDSHEAESHHHRRDDDDDDALPNG